jgi:integrase
MTETAISKAIRESPQTGRRELADAGCPGLRLRVTPAGSATWVLACRDRLGRMRRFPLGSYPAIGISEARSEARALHTKVRQEGVDPIAERRRERAIGKAAKVGIGTLAAVLAIYERHQGKNLKSWPSSRVRIERVFKPLLRRAVAELELSELQMAADAYHATQSAAFAVRTIRPALKWAAHRGYIAAELAGIRTPATVKRRRRVLNRDELAALLPVLRQSTKPHAAAIRFMLLTLARLGEAGSARWRDLDMVQETWAIKETKNGEPHTVPLSRQAVQLLSAIKPADANPDALIFATSTGAPLGNWDRETKALHYRSGTTGWHRHDLRRTGATMLGEMGELPDIIEAALNHTSIRSPLAATYNRSRYRPRVAAALQRLADALDGIETGSAEVVPIRVGA